MTRTPSGARPPVRLTNCLIAIRSGFTDSGTVETRSRDACSRNLQLAIGQVDCLGSVLLVPSSHERFELLREKVNALLKFGAAGESPVIDDLLFLGGLLQRVLDARRQITNLNEHKVRVRLGLDLLLLDGFIKQGFHEMRFSAHPADLHEFEIGAI